MLESCRSRSNLLFYKDKTKKANGIIQARLTNGNVSWRILRVAAAQEDNVCETANQTSVCLEKAFISVAQNFQSSTSESPAPPDIDSMICSSEVSWDKSSHSNDWRCYGKLVRWAT